MQRLSFNFMVPQHMKRPTYAPLHELDVVLSHIQKPVSSSTYTEINSQSIGHLPTTSSAGSSKLLYNA